MSEEEVKFSFQAGIPKEKIQVLDNVLNSLFSAINTKMKEADHFMKKVQNAQDSFHSHSSPNRFEPLRNDHEEDDHEEDDHEEDDHEEDDHGEETEEDDHGEETEEDDHGEETEEDEQEIDLTQRDVDDDGTLEDEEDLAAEVEAMLEKILAEKKEADDEDEDEEEVPHIFLLYENHNVVGYTTTIKAALNTLEELYNEFSPKTCGDLLRVEREHTGIKVYKKIPYLWSYGEELIYESSYQIILKV
jgi:hypothetical protein